MKWFRLLVLAGTASCGAGTPRPSTPSTEAIVYEVDVDASRGVLEVQAHLPIGKAATLWISRGGADFVEGAEYFDGARTLALARHGDRFDAPSCRERACIIRHRFALDRAAAAWNDFDSAQRRGDVVIGSTAYWLLRPVVDVRGTSVHMIVRATPGTWFSTGMLSRRQGARVDVEIDGTDLADPPLSVLATHPPLTIGIRGATVDVVTTPARRDDGSPSTLSPDAEELARWARTNVDATAQFFGRLPVSHALLIALPREGVDDQMVGDGVTAGGSGASIAIDVGARVTRESFADDWVLPHELVHLAVPVLSRRHHWLEEGLAVYVEPLVRVAAGLQSPEAAWLGLAKGLKKGLPEPGDRGLDGTPTWGRTYWGGGLFCLLADVEIHRRTGNRKGVRDGLRAIVSEGGSIAAPWPIERVLAAFDQSVGTPVLSEMYARWRDAPVDVDVDALLRDLGIDFDGKRVRLTDEGALVAVRKSILG